MTDVATRAFDLGRKEGKIEGARQKSRRAAFTASARVIETTSESEQERHRKRRANYQEEAWTYYDALSEVKSGARFKGRSLRKLRLFAGYKETASAQPVDVYSEDENGEPVVPIEIANIASQVLGQLTETGCVPDILERWGEHGFVIGESYLVGWEDPESVTGETWYMATPDELQVTSRGEWGLRLEPGQREQDWLILPPDDLIVIRVWYQHARYGGLPDSPVNGVLDLCELLLTLHNMTVGASMSRLPNGVTVWPDGMIQPANDRGDDSDGEAQRSPTIDDINQHLMAPIGNPRSAAAVVPFQMTADAEDISAIRQLNFDRPFDAVADRRMDKTIVRLANGVDLPAEIITGFADVNHWGAWFIGDQTFRAYLQPDADEFVGAVTRGYYQVRLAAAGVPIEWVRKLVVWYDASELVTDPDDQDMVFRAVELKLLGSQGARRRLGIAESEAPTDEDLEEETADEGGDETVDEGDGNGEEPDEAVAGSRRRDLRAVSRKWAQRDRALRDRLLAQADAAMTRALDKAGARLRSKAITASKTHAEIVQSVPNNQVASLLGPGVVAAVGVAPDDLLSGSFDELAARFDSQVARAQRATRADLVSLGLSELDESELEVKQEEDRERGKIAFIGAITALATARLYNPSPTAPPLGEHDTSLTVPASLVRSSISIAGGAQGRAIPGGAIQTAHGKMAGELATGETIMAALPSVGLRTDESVWNYGDISARSHNFEPHLDLDGQTFTGPDDPALSNPDPFPETSFYWPGDHDGCSCDVQPLLSEVE